MKPKKLQKIYKNSTNNSNSNVLLFLVFWLIPVLWVVTIPRNNQPYEEETFTANVLKNGQFVIKKFQETFNYVPRNISEIRIFSRFLKRNFIPFDGYGQRLEYFNFDHEQWYLRSFGKDGKQNTLMSPQDPLVANMTGRVETGIQHQYTTQSLIYNPVILSGSSSPKNDWLAKLYQDHNTGSSKLLVRHKTKKNYFLIAMHNTIEEFYWLPDGSHIVYTATGSNRYKDGIYLWNLLNDNITPIFPIKNNVDTATYSTANQFWNISLAGITTQTPPRLLAFVNNRTRPELNVSDFYLLDNFVEISLPIKERMKAELSLDPKNSYNAYLREIWTTSFGIANCQLGSSLQVDWCALPTQGNLEFLIDQWQTFGEKSARSPQFPYVLWYLALYYERMLDHLESQKATSDQVELHTKDVDIMRSYGLELSTALVNLFIAPGWIRSAALAKQLRFKQLPKILEETNKMEQLNKKIENEKFILPEK